MGDMLVKTESLSAVADAIREKGGTSEQLAFPAGFVSAIAAISAGGGGSAWVQTGTITPESDMFLASTFTGIPVDDSNGKPDVLCLYEKVDATNMNPTYTNALHFAIAAPEIIGKAYFYVTMDTSRNRYLPDVSGADKEQQIVKDGNSGYYHIALKSRTIGCSLLAGKVYGWFAIGGLFA